MKRIVLFLALCIVLGATPALLAQPGAYPKDALLACTPLWKGERFTDGRPKVPDDLLTRMKKVSMEEAWGVLREKGYLNQFEGGWKRTMRTRRSSDERSPRCSCPPGRM